MAITMLLPSGALAGSGGVGTPAPTTHGAKAKLRHGKAIAPASAPRRVKRAIAAANHIAGKPYIMGGGHARWHDRGYDCSGAISYVLGKYGAKVLRSPLPSGNFMRGGWGIPGKGKWITTYANSGHMYAMIAGLRFESHTSGSGPAWAKQRATRAGYTLRHWKGL